MPKYFVELSARYYYEGDIEANDEDEAVERAMNEADEEIRWEPIDWDVDYVELLESPAVEEVVAVDENQEKLF